MLKNLNKPENGTKIVPFLLFLTLLIPSAYAQAPGQDTLELQIHAISLNFIYLSSAIIGIVSAGLIIYGKKLGKNEFLKKTLFLLITASVLATTFFVAGATIYLNVNSETKGPVHWHADYEIWACGEKLDLKDPRGLSNRVGTPTFHEHNDDRIHVEGVVVKLHEVSLSTYFSVLGGHLEKGYMKYPSTEGVREYRDGDDCGGKPAKLQMWLHRIDNPDEQKRWVYRTEKIKDYPEYVLNPETLVPPGDCFILEFGPEKDETDRVCETYRVAEQRGELRGS